jgi:hypothetical protein
MENKKNSFEILNDINLVAKTKAKMGLSYLSWAYAWGELLKNFPDAFMTVYTDNYDWEETVTKTEADGTTTTFKKTGHREIPYFNDGRSAYVKVGVTIDDKEYVEIYPIMDNHNKSLDINLVRSTDYNKAIQRAFVKACARHGLGLYIYAGEDIPESEKYAPVALTDSNDFATVQAEVIELAQRLLANNEQKDEAARYITEMFPNKRLSQTTEEDLDGLLKARVYLAQLNRQ